MAKLKCGQILYKGLAIPATAVVHTSGENREFYISGQSFQKALVEIRYIDNGQFEKIQASRMAKYITVQRIINDEENKKIKQPSKNKFDTPSAYAEVAKSF